MPRKKSETTTTKPKQKRLCAVGSPHSKDRTKGVPLTCVDVIDSYADNDGGTGSGGTNNFPQAMSPDAPDYEFRLHCQNLMRELLTEFRQPVVNTTEELAQRFSDYFDRCAAEGRAPVLEEMYATTGYTFRVISQWLAGQIAPPEPGFSLCIEKARDFLMAFDAKLVVTGKVNFLTYCFRAKNFYGLTDRKETVQIAQDAAYQGLTEEELSTKYALSAPDDQQ